LNETFDEKLTVSRSSYSQKTLNRKDSTQLTFATKHGQDLEDSGIIQHNRSL